MIRVIQGNAEFRKKKVNIDIQLDELEIRRSA